MTRVTNVLLALACGAVTISAGRAVAQAQPKPKSPKEIEALRAVQSATTADERLKAIDNVLTKFADTEFKAQLLQIAMQTAEQKNDYPQTMFYAEQLLEASPKNAFALVTLAGETARHTREFDLDKEEKLAKAEKYANETLANIPNIPKLPERTDDQMNAIKKDVSAQAHEALGMIASVRKKYDVAINEFKTALSEASAPDPATYIRLGQAYEDAHQFDDANAALDKALNSPGVSAAVKQIAQAKKNEVAKMKAAAGGAPPAPAPAPDKP